jgi:ectoine hydroxylase-related dioxygenase (phytanoyl-CoA dioxygenase family)
MLSKSDIDSYNRDGAILIKKAIEPRWLQRIEKAIQQDMQRPGPFFSEYKANRGKFHGNNLNWLTYSDLADFVVRSPLPEMASQLLASEKVNLLYDQMFVKLPGTDAPTPWHHDQVVWPISGRQVISFWIALDEVTEANGRVKYVRGSHKWDALFQPYVFAGGKNKFPINPKFVEMPDIDGNPDTYELVTWDMEPGDAVAFTSRTVHGAGPNDGLVRRGGYSIRYCGDDVRYDTSHAFSPYLRNPELKPGDQLDSQLFPVVWRHGKPAATLTVPPIERFLPGGY